MKYKQAIIAAALSCLIPSIVSAVVTIRVESIELPTPGISTNGFVDVYVEVDPLGSGPQISGWDLELDLVSSSSGVVFTGAEAPSGLHPSVIPDSNLFSIVSPNRVQATNMLLSGTAELLDQSGLLRVNFSIAEGTIGLFKVQVVPGSFTNFVGAADNPDPVEFMISGSEGSIKIGDVAAVAVPEPNTVLLGSFVLCALGIRYLRGHGTYSAS